MEWELVTATRRHLSDVVTSSLANGEPHSVAFVERILSGSAYSANIAPQVASSVMPGNAVYEGFPQVASTGFRIDEIQSASQETKAQFLAGVDRLRSRSEAGLRSLFADDLAILGIASGIAVLGADDDPSVEPLRAWMLEVIDNPPRARQWSYRMRELAGDLLDGRGRLRAMPSTDDLSARALEVVLRQVWSDAFARVSSQSDGAHEVLLRDLLRIDPPSSGELEKAAVWLRALDITLERLTESALPAKRTAVEALRALTSIKGSLDRRAVRRVRTRFWLSFGMLLIVEAALAYLTYRLGWDVMEPWTYFIGLAVPTIGYLYFAITNRELSPVAIYEQSVRSQMQKVYSSNDFDLAIYEELVRESSREISKES